jgi:hypothetical protein
MASSVVQIRPAAPRARLDLRVGDVVVVRSEAEILATLDERGELDALPFMPEMLQFCGKRFTVDKVAHKLCDTVSRSGMRRMRDGVHLEGVRCDAGAHGGCQTACLFYWKEAWLERADERGAQVAAPTEDPRVTVSDLYELATRPGGTDGEVLFTCQATELLRAAPELLPLRSIGQYVDDVRSGNASVLDVVRAFLVGLFNHLQAASKRVLPRRLWFRDGLRWRFVKGTLTRTPTGHTDLQPGELVRIRSQAEIMSTLDKNLRNRGLGFEEEMARHCGREARVLRRVDRCIEESTGRMLQMKNPCIVLEDVICEGTYTAMCPRSIYAFWREIWLERVDDPAGRASAGVTNAPTETG